MTKASILRAVMNYSGSNPIALVTYERNKAYITFEQELHGTEIDLLGLYAPLCKQTHSRTLEVEYW